MQQFTLTLLSRRAYDYHHLKKRGVGAGGGVVGGRGYSGVQVTEMIEWKQKSKFQKIPRASNKTQKNPIPSFRALKISKNH